MNLGNLLYNGDNYSITSFIIGTDNKISYDDLLIEKRKDRFRIFLYDNIEKIEFTNDMNSPIMYGYMEYTDNSDSVLADIIQLTNHYITVRIDKLLNTTQKSPNTLIIKDFTFEQTFMVNNITKVNQDSNGKITYGFNMISQDWWNFNNNLFYTTHKIGKESPIELLAKLYNLAGIEGFDKKDITTSVKIDYISNVNDCLESAQNYLLKRMYDINNMETPGLCKVVYNHLTNKYSLWCAKQSSGAQYRANVYPTVNLDMYYKMRVDIPVYDDYVSTMSSQDKNSLYTVNGDTMENVYKNTFEYVYHEYDYTTNTFKKSPTITNKKILNSLPRITDQPLSMLDKYNSIDNMLSKKNYKGTRVFNREYSKWDQSYFPYYDIHRLFMESGGIAVEVAGDLRRKSGDTTFVAIDNTDISPLSKYSGDWINTKVSHVFTKGKYRNVVFLTRFNVTR